MARKGSTANQIIIKHLSQHFFIGTTFHGPKILFMNHLFLTYKLITVPAHNALASVTDDVVM
jgi:hypothetical protein